MSRWEPDARERLERAALGLFLEHGFDQTTVPQIARQAGLTTRTFFRYFDDKREVLFVGEDVVPERVADIMARSPDDLAPMQLIEHGFAAMAPMFEGRVEQLRQRRTVIDGNDGLRERELRKVAILSDAITEGFLRRGIGRLDARLLAETSATVFRVSLNRWLDDPERGLVAVLHETLSALLAVTGITPATTAATTAVAETPGAARPR